MRRVETKPRKDWVKRVEEHGLTYHTHANGAPYWQESAHYRFSARQVEQIEMATAELQSRCLTAAQYIIDNDLFAKLGIPAHAVPLIKRAWEAEPPALYGRFDLAYNGKDEPKLLEYNADTPTSLLEAAVTQWYWLYDVFPGADQFNSLHEKLVEKWKQLRPYLWGKVVHFAHMNDEATEDTVTATYVRETAQQAGLLTEGLLVNQLGWNGERFVDNEDKAISSIFKLYPWEWLVHEEFGQHLEKAEGYTQWIEPIWKMLLSNKGILTILWELNPDHPNLLPAFEDGPRSMTDYVRKPKLSREGANITLVKGGATIETPGDYGEEGFVFQALAPLPEFNGKYPVIGSWMIDQEPAGMGIRESDMPISDNRSSFVPHLFE